ncbi:MAG: PHP domain-containing protein [Candidatus Margulisiibacteriota bacterium]
MKLVADLHVHTVSSGHAYSTLAEYVARAKKIGLQALAITDHGPAMPGAPHYYHFANMRMIPRVIDGVRILRGIEANVINDRGELDIKPVDIKWGELDIVLVAMHPRCGYQNQGAAKNTAVMIRALRHPGINIIAHLDNPQFPVNIKQVVAAAKARKIAIELNNSSPLSRPGSEAMARELVRAVKAADWQLVLGTDSHIASMLGDFTSAKKLLKQVGLKEKNVVNTSWAKIEKYLLSKKVSTR